MGIKDRLIHAWQAFRKDGVANDIEDESVDYTHYANSSSSRPDRLAMTTGNDSSIITPIFSKIASDIASATFRHCMVDENNKFLKTIDSPLNKVLNIEANTDQTGRDLIRDIVISLIDEGSVAIVPIETELDPSISDRLEIYSMRVGKITQWLPNHVRIELYNERNGEYQEITLPKKAVAIIENPHYLIMNEPNSTLKRLVSKLNLLDAIDTQSGSGKLDLIIQLPFTIKTEAKRKQAQQRMEEIENQLTNTKYGVAYTDATEKIVQLNRPVVNNLMEQIIYLSNLLYSQLGISEGVYRGTADEAEMLNYWRGTLEPIIEAIVHEMRRKFITETGRKKGESIMYFRDPFKLVPVSQIAEIADKFTRNEIASSNDMRAVIGWVPSDNPNADELRNKNIPAPKEDTDSKNIKKEESNEI